jgi:hypothetical protein
MGLARIYMEMTDVKPWLSERFIKSYVEKLGNCQYVNVSGDHCIYAYKTDEVERNFLSWIKATIKQFMPVLQVILCRRL